MKFELLPNEILLDLFEYLSHTDLFCAFYGLNSRFNLLLNSQIRFYYLNLNSISKRCFDMICRQHLSFIADRVRTLYLSDSRETPEEINLFCSSIPSFNIFTHLQSLSLSNIHCYETLIRIVNQCQHLCNLTHLKFYSCIFPSSETDFQLIVNNIWSLSKLTNCQFGIDIKSQTRFCMPTIISTSLECITISNGKLQWEQAKQLFHHTPYLKHFSTDFDHFTYDDDDYYFQPSPVLTLIRFNLILLSFEPTIGKLMTICATMPNLYCLDITILNGLIDGNKWERLISSYLPKLKTFRLQMQKTVHSSGGDLGIIPERVDKLINSFQSLFWIGEHQWFVRCITQNRTIHLYTLPNTSDYYKDIFPDSWKSTYPQDNQQEIYNKLTTIHNEIFFDKSISSNIRLTNLNYLRIKFPINDKFWSIVPNLNRLKTLIISSYNDKFQSQLRSLLNRASYLHTLRIGKGTPLLFQIFKDTNISVRWLNLYNNMYSYNNKECIILSRSSLGAQCEVLWISVKNRNSIIDFVKNMINLRVLIVECTDENHRKSSTLTINNNEIIQWLKDRLPSTYFIVRDTDVDGNIIIWM